MTLRSRGAGRGEGVPRGRGGGINGGEERRRRRRWWRRRRQSRRRWRGVQPVSLVLAVPRPPLCPTTGIHLPLQPVPSVSLHRRRPGVGDNLALAPSLPAGTAEEGRGRSRPRTRLRPRPARLLACSPARPLARSLASLPRHEKVRPPARLHYLPDSLRPTRECPREGWRAAPRSIAHGRADKRAFPLHRDSRAPRSNGPSFILLLGPPPFGHWCLEKVSSGIFMDIYIFIYVYIFVGLRRNVLRGM